MSNKKRIFFIFIFFILLFLYENNWGDIFLTVTQIWKFSMLLMHMQVTASVLSLTEEVNISLQEVLMPCYLFGMRQRWSVLGLSIGKCYRHNNVVPLKLEGAKLPLYKVAAQHRSSNFKGMLSNLS